jgi:TolB-like protein/Tfp pilus assembly protein PilF
MARIFLSYAREDRACAERLARAMESAGHEVWWDRHLDSGEEFASEIEAELDKAQVVLVAWSATSIKSRWVRDEAAVGGDTNRLIPVSIDGTLPPMGFRQFHTLDLAGWKGAKRDHRTTELLHSIERRLKGAEAKAAPAALIAQRRHRFVLPKAKAIWGAAAALLLLAVAGAGWWLLSGRGTGNAATSKPTFALLPLTTASADPRLRELATETSDSLSAKLSQSGFPVKLLKAAPQGAVPPADYIITGDFSGEGDKVAATLHLNQAAEGVTITTYRFEASGQDVQNLPERIGVQTAGNLSGSVSELTLDPQHPTDPTVLAEMMRFNFKSNDWLESYQSMQRLLQKEPDLRMAQVGLAYYTAFALDQFPGDQRPPAIAEARHAYDRSRVLDPSNGDVEGSWCLLRSETMFGECEDRLRAGMSRSPDDSWLNDFLAALLSEVGRFDEAAQLQQLSYTHDPYAPNKIAHMLRMLEFTGQAADAQQLYDDGVRWWPEQSGLFLRARLLGLIWRGDLPAVATLEKQLAAPNYRKSTEIVAALNSKSVPALRRACADALSDSADPLFLPRCFVAYNWLGDEDSAYALADKMYPRRVGKTPAETEQIWINDPDGGAPPQLLTSAPAAPLRRDPRFLALAQRTGLLAYWRSGRPPDFCRRNREPECRVLLHGK